MVHNFISPSCDNTGKTKFSTGELRAQVSPVPKLLVPNIDGPDNTPIHDCFRIHNTFVSPCYYQDHTWSNADSDKACHNSVLVVDNWLTKWLIQNNHC